MNGDERQSLDYYFGRLEGKVDALVKTVNVHLSAHSSADAAQRAAVEAAELAAAQAKQARVSNRIQIVAGWIGGGVLAALTAAGLILRLLGH